MRGLLVALVLVVACGPSGQSVTPAPSSSPAPSPTVDAQTPSPVAQVARIGEQRSDRARVGATDATPAQMNAVVDADAAFALRLYQQLVADSDGNLFFSPYSVSTAMSMALAGTRGNTADEIRAALGVEGDESAWHAGRNRIDLTLADSTGRILARGDETATPLTLEPTNAMFGQAGYAFREEFLGLLASYYGAGLQTVDFSGQTESARVAINEWVARRTHDRIEELLKEGLLSALTRTVLINAIYFKGGWLDEFSPDKTAPAPFHLLDGSDVEVQMMDGFSRTAYAEGDGWAAVTLGYWGSASMILLLPDEGRFADIEGQLDAQFLADLTDRLTGHDVDVKLPRWESESDVSLVPALKALGIHDAFDPGRADFSGTTLVEPLYIGDVVHQANITVNEEGTEAAAATAVIEFGVSRCCEPATLVADRPFIYLIRDDITGEILFLGRLLEP